MLREFFGDYCVTARIRIRSSLHVVYIRVLSTLWVERFTAGNCGVGAIIDYAMMHMHMLHIKKASLTAYSLLSTRYPISTAHVALS